MKRIFGLNSAVMILLLLVFGGSDLRAAWGNYDTTFGFLGAAIDPVTSHYPVAVALQPDGKILVTGYKSVNGYKKFFLRRYLSNGSLDTSFGNNGSAVPGAIVLTSADYSGTGIAVQDNGRIAVVGYGNGKRVVWRFYSNGSPDSSIGYGGMKTLSSYPYPGTIKDAIEAHGNNLIVSVSDSANKMVMVRILSSGAIDANFGSGGEAATSFHISAYRVSTEPSTGDIIVAGTFNGGGSFGLMRWRENGDVDPSFQVDPQDTGVFITGDHIKQQNGNYLMREKFWGYMNQLPSGAAFHEFRANGQYNRRVSFEYFPYLSAVEPCPSVFAEQSDGRIVAGGVSKLYRFDADLNAASKQSSNCDSYASVANPTEAVLQPDDKMLSAGRYNGSIILVRTLP